MASMALQGIFEWCWVLKRPQEPGREARKSREAGCPPKSLDSATRARRQVTPVRRALSAPVFLKPLCSNTARQLLTSFSSLFDSLLLDRNGSH